MTILAVLAAIAISIGPFQADTAHAAASTEHFSTGWAPFAGISLNNCNGEDVIMSGVSKEDLAITEDGSGGVHVFSQFRLRLVGVGVVTGAEYFENDGGQSHITQADTVDGVTTFGFALPLLLISSDKTVPDLHGRILGHFTLDANGNLRSFFDVFEIFCR